MTTDNDNEVRINIVIQREENDILTKLLPWGAKSKIIRNIVQVLIADLSDDPDGTLYAALVNNKVKLTPIKQ